MSFEQAQHRGIASIDRATGTPDVLFREQLNRWQPAEISFAPLADELLQQGLFPLQG